MDESRVYTDPSKSNSESKFKNIIHSINDDGLDETVFRVHLNIMAEGLATIYNPVVYEKLNFALDVLRWLLNKCDSNHAMKQNFAKAVALKPNLISLAVKGITSCLESYGKQYYDL